MSESQPKHKSLQRRTLLKGAAAAGGALAFPFVRAADPITLRYSDYETRQDRPHNLILEMLHNFGVIGFLAYAAVFGLGANWAKYFQNLGGVPLPGWFYAFSGSRGDSGAMVAVMSSSDSSGASAGAGGCPRTRPAGRG